MMSRYVATYMKLWYAAKPTIAAVQGWCVGGGTDLVLCADIIVAGEGARFGYPPSRVWGTPTTAMWVYRMGLERAKRYMLTGDEIPAMKAAEIGLILECVADADLDRHARALAERMAQVPTTQLVMLKLLCNQTAENMGLGSSRALGTLVRRHRPPHAGRPRLRGARARRRLPPGGARARRPVRRLRQPQEGLTCPEPPGPARCGHAVRLPRPPGAPGVPPARPNARSAEDAVPPSDGLTGRDIYQRVLDNKLDTSYIEHRMVSTDPGGSEQTLSFWSRFKDLRSPEKAPDGAVISKTVMKFTSPYDKRDTAYLFIEKKGGADDGYHYSRARTRVSRISPAKESIFGSDFSLDDLAVVRHIDDATYERLPDEVVQGKPVWVVDVHHKPESKPAYARSMLYVDKDRNVPLRTRHWDEAGVEVKELDIPSEKIRQFAGVWIPMESHHARPVREDAVRAVRRPGDREPAARRHVVRADAAAAPGRGDPGARRGLALEAEPETEQPLAERGRAR